MDLAHAHAIFYSIRLNPAADLSKLGGGLALLDVVLIDASFNHDGALIIG